MWEYLAFMYSWAIRQNHVHFPTTGELHNSMQDGLGHFPQLGYLIPYSQVHTQRMPAKQNSWGSRFDSRWVLGFFLLFLSLSRVALIRSLKVVQHYWFSSTKNGCLGVQLGQNKHNMHRFGKKIFSACINSGTNRLSLFALLCEPIISWQLNKKPKGFFGSVAIHFSKQQHFSRCSAQYFNCKKIESAEIGTRGCWVRSANATSVLSCPLEAN